LAWLDRQEDRSVVYVSLVSFTVISHEQFKEFLSVLVRSLHRYGPKAVTGWIPRPGRGAQPIHGWWAPVAQCYKERVGTTARSTRFTAPPHTPHPTNPNRPREHWSGGKLRHRRRRAPLRGSGAPGVTVRPSTAS
jgi:hypothetical protein